MKVAEKCLRNQGLGDYDKCPRSNGVTTALSLFSAHRGIHYNRRSAVAHAGRWRSPFRDIVYSMAGIVQVGLIGVNPVWKSRYLPAFQALCQRARIAAVYDPVLSRAKQAAEELGAKTVTGIHGLLQSPTVDAILLNDTGWMGLQVLRLLCRQSKPVYVVGGFGDELAYLEDLRHLATASGCTMMPELSRRFTPSTGRLKELVATHLGRPVEVRVHALLPQAQEQEPLPGQKSDFDFLIGLVDWSCYITDTAPRLLETATGQEQEQIIRIQFTQSRAGGISPVETISLWQDRSRFNGQLVQLYVRCERGEATLHSPTALTWKTRQGEIHEELAEERHEVVVMLDHFLRRVVGGLVSVADLDDVIRNFKLVKSIQQSRQHHVPIPLDGQAN